MDISVNELRKAVISDDELSFSNNGRDFILYGWDQCDGYVLSFECDGELIWQSAPMPRSACADEFIKYYTNSQSAVI